jgi:hypothetical protein
LKDVAESTELVVPETSEKQPRYSNGVTFGGFCGKLSITVAFPESLKLKLSLESMSNVRV